jgi:XTP/dITP diphosphohydrolase
LKALVATGNRGKLAELRALFAGSGLELSLPFESGVTLPHVEETGATYLDNALLKARALAAASGLPALADDSGLEVDALGGAPGVRSARYAGEGATDETNNARLLKELTGTMKRNARFRCVLVLVIPNGETISAEGTLEGTIGTEPRGKNGFGYDPIFVLPDGRHVAELAPEEKQRISHRAVAARILVKLLVN